MTKTNQKLNDYIEENREELLGILRRLCAVPSVAGEKTGENAPYGEGCRRVLDEALSIAEEYGFETHDDAGYAMHAQTGQGAELIGVMAHLDVVPAGDGWKSDPFCLDIRDGRAYARGAVDNKGPAAATLFAMHALDACGVKLSRRVRLIMGCNEENGMDDLSHYFANNEMPLWGFTPDAQFPVINCEKHIFHARFKKKIDAMGKIAKIAAGERFNVVPEKAQANLSSPLDAREEAAVRDYAAKNGVRVDVTEDSITVYGVAAHASHPETGVNAAAHLVRLIDAARLACGDDASAIAYLAKHVGLECDGASLGMACRDEESGALTCNFGILTYENGELCAGFDMRCPVTQKPDDLRARMDRAAKDGGFSMEVAHFDDGILVDKDAELIRVLLDVYETETGRPGELLAIGGGTYARQMPNRAVAFGPCFPEQEDMCHQRDEYIAVDDLVTVCKIVAQALCRLAG